MRSERPLTTGDAARYCHVSRVTILEWIKRGRLRAYRTAGGHYRIDKVEFRAFLQRYGMPIREEFFQDS